jgi:predicted Zn-dependent protease
MGTVRDEAGQPVEGVQVRAVMQGEKDVFTDRTNKKGDWTLNGMASGQWNVDFVKDGYDKRSVAVPFSESTRTPAMQITIKKTVVKVDPNAAIRAQLEKAAPLLESGKYAEARAVYEDLLKQYPDAWKLEPLIARTYAGEQNTDQAIAHLQNALTHAPEDVELKLLMAGMLVEQKKIDEARKYLDTIDMAKAKDSTPFLNAGIALINQGKAEEALPIFDKVVASFPNEPDGFYYRARGELAAGKFPEAKADFQKFVAMPGADAAHVADAKKILDQMK